MKLSFLDRYLIAFVLLAVFAVRFSMARLNPNFLYADEIFQSLEQSHRLVFGYGHIPWEYVSGTRNWLFPGFLAVFIWLGSIFSKSSFAYILLTEGILILLSLLPCWFSYSYCKRKYGTAAGIVAALIAGCWFELIFFAPKAFSEVVAAHVFFGALAALLYADGKSNRRYLLLAGLLLGIASVLRMHYGPVLLLCLVYFAVKKTPNIRFLIIGFVIAVATAGLLDGITWDYPFQSFFLNFYKNVVQNKAAHWGTHPWWFFFERYWSDWHVVLIGMGVLSLWGIRQHPLLGGCLLAVVVPHLFIGHKEFRFLYLASCILVVLSALGLVHLIDKLKKAMPRAVFYVTPLCLGVYLFCSAYLGMSFDYWNKDSAYIQVFRYLSQRDDVRDIIVPDKPFWRFGGYYSLHHNVKVLYKKRLRRPLNKNINFLIDNQDKAKRAAQYGFEKIRCFSDEVCLYKRRPFPGKPQKGQR